MSWRSRLLRWGPLGVLYLTLGLLTLPSILAGPPAPWEHDEYGYLLSAETFHSGRLTNPTPRHWEHFETFHQTMRPTYQSKYPPAQALFLAAGMALGHPVLGVWLGAVLLIAALMWMLRAFVPVRWVVLGGALAALQLLGRGRAHGLGTTAYWGQSYWGGAVAAAGGALLVGALARTVRRPSLGASFAMGMGLALLANSRPKEGALVALPVAVVLLVWLVRRRGAALSRALAVTVAPVALLLGLTAAGTMTYNRAVTGEATRMPWLEHYEQYCTFPVFAWQEPRSGVTWNNEELARFHGELEPSFATHPRGPAFAQASKLFRTWSFFVGPFLTLALLALPWMWRRRGVPLAAGVCALMVANDMASYATLAHYVAPVTGFGWLLVVQGLRQLQQLRWGRRRAGVWLVRAIVLGLVLSAVVGMRTAVAENAEKKQRRPRVEEELLERGGRHLVFVRYGPKHGVGDEWVFNAADLEAAPIVWARELDAASNAALVADSADREVWLLEIGFGPGVERPIPYVP